MIYFDLFLIGLLGSMHCIGMCGGFVSMYTLRKPEHKPVLPYHLLYNAGRLTTYMLLGGILGHLGSFSAYADRHRAVPGLILLLSGVLMTMMGLNIAGVVGKQSLFESTGLTGSSLFRSGLHRILSFRSTISTYLLGLLLGLLPCGLLYPVLIHAASSGGFIRGAGEAVIFGFGTVPAMISFGSLIGSIRPHLRLYLYRGAAALIVLLGLHTLMRGLSFLGLIPHGRFW